MLSYQDVQELLVASTSVRAIGRILSCTPATVLNRKGRMTDAQKVKAAELKEAELNETGHLTPEPTVTPIRYLCAQLSSVIDSAPVNYADREFRKDLCEHGRKTICYGKNVNNHLDPDGSIWIGLSPIRSGITIRRNIGLMIRKRMIIYAIIRRQGS